MFSTLKNYFLQKYLTAHKPSRQKQLISLQRAKNIGMICEITDEDSYKNIFYIFTQLQEHGHNIKLIGYIDEKIVPFYCLPQLSADYFCQKQLNWYGRPNMIQVDDFIKTEYDMLLDFNASYHSAIRTILALNKSKFIVGHTAENQDLYDLYIDTATTDAYNFLESVSKYTQKLTGNDR